MNLSSPFQLHSSLAHLSDENSRLRARLEQTQRSYSALLHGFEAQVETRVGERILALQSQIPQTDQHRLISELTHRFRQSLHLDQILETTVTDLRHCIHADRVLIYRLLPDDRGQILAESVVPGCLSLLNHPPDQFEALFHQSVLHQIEQCGSDPCGNPGHPTAIQLEAYCADRCCPFCVQASLAMPILQHEIPWGVVLVHQCDRPRTWHPWETDLLHRLTEQLAMAIQQSELYHRVQQLNDHLEQQVQERTAQLELAFDFEATLKRITDRVRDSLDENQIMQAAVEELAHTLNVSCCNAALYDLARGTSTICYEATRLACSERGRTAYMADYPEIYEQLLRGETFQFCSVTPHPHRGRVVMLAQPIRDNKGVLGDLWLINPIDVPFQEQDIRLVQQVANQCAIALRQAQLYQAAQAQVTELERLNRLKDDFLSTVSHELRTPMTNMKMAIQMLELMLSQTEQPDNMAHRVTQYFQILKNECQRETSLINDLLDLSRLEAGSEPLILTPCDPHDFLMQTIEPFMERAHLQQQRMRVLIPEALPVLTTDVSHLEGILVELLNNACKYTPAQEAIEIAAKSVPPGLELTVRNSGVDIPPGELDHLFDKFYRVPKNDPWKHGGTGLGLSLLQKRVNHLNGTVKATLYQHWLTFTVRIPGSLESQQAQLDAQPDWTGNIGSA